MDLDRDTQLIFEIGTMRHLARTWNQFGGVTFANVAEHTMRVAWISLVIASREGADCGKVVQLALIHDAAETRTGDVHYMSRLYTDRHEAKALDDMTAETSLEWVQQLWHEYEQQESLEARIVKDADTLDVDFELRELAATGSHLPQIFKPIRDGVNSKLRTKTAVELYESLLLTNPHSWHLQGKNRATAGDWQGLTADAGPPEQQH
ncbi:HD domain-containing protein [Micromonospora trifolii]|uniref:HD domain-containing protein n=1 Tax=Micromonospora trifolii TaxID=2911208 RepID=UPI003D2F40AB